MPTVRLRSANNEFQRVETLRRNRTLRHRHREVFVEGVRPINQALRHGWSFKSIWHEEGRPLSTWAQDVIAAVPAAKAFALPAGLMRRLSERDEPSELVAVVEMRTERLEALAPRDDAALILVADRPGSPGNLGTTIRSCDGLGAHALVVSGHSADPFDPLAIRASMGSVFAVPVVQVGGPAEVADFVQSRGMSVVGTDSAGAESIDQVDLTGPTVVLLGNEAQGLSYAFRQLCDTVARIPLVGSADSLNVAAAATIVLYEAARQRRRAG